MKIKPMILKLEQNKKKIKELEEENSILSKQIISAMDRKEKKKVSFQEEDEQLNVVMVIKNDLKFNLELLKSKLSKEIYKQVTVKQTEVDKAELREIISNNPKLRQLLKPALITSVVLDENSLQKMLSTGKIEKESLEGTYDIKSTKYLKISRKKEEIDELG